ncbi:hypothetical protein PVE_R1G5386 [Pseudomonas veronii 1YdBTEX2]|uniref:Uncharacterized protein n=1 Tax=Pseudomonas veronii 1YdBTEX2 TaxID=1295141 RepID=A0A1D3K4H3_PSEVE|nr:hypothetical protein PVE_R1G5386 [Pseudomonas veronii 1YdBTEX2]
MVKSWTIPFRRIPLRKQRRLRRSNGEFSVKPESFANTARVAYKHFSDAGGYQSLLELLPSRLGTYLLNPRHSKYVLVAPIRFRNLFDVADLQHCELDVSLPQEQTKPSQKIVIQCDLVGGKGIVQCRLCGRAFNVRKRPLERIHRQDCCALAVPLEANTFEKAHSSIRHAWHSQAIPLSEKGAQGA